MSHTRPFAEHELAALGWPPLLTTPRAVLYTGCSKSKILRAVRSGELGVAGRRGRVFVFRRADLDQWLTGATSGATAPVAPVIPISRARAPLSESLKRIRRAAGRDDE